MKRKKAIKEKRKAIYEIDCQIIDQLSEVMKLTANPEEVKKPFDFAFKSIAHMSKIKTLQFQRDVVASQPIPSKGLKKGYIISEKGNELITSTDNTRVTQEQTAKLLHAHIKRYNKDYTIIDLSSIKRKQGESIEINIKDDVNIKLKL